MDSLAKTVSAKDMSFLHMLLNKVHVGEIKCSTEGCIEKPVILETSNVGFEGVKVIGKCIICHKKEQRAKTGVEIISNKKHLFAEIISDLRDTASRCTISKRE